VSGPPVDVLIGSGVAHVTLARAAAHNALSPALLQGLTDAVEAATAAGCRVVTIRGAGPALSAGADLPYLLGLLDDPEPTAAVHSYIASIGAVLDAIEEAPFISVCVVDGYGVAGGCELMLACDLAVASRDARIGDRHMEYGMLPGAGGSVRLPRALPAALARRLLYTGEIIDGDTAAAWGLVGWSVAPEELDGCVDTVVARLLRHSPTALADMKRMYAAGLDADRRTALDRELVTVVRHLVHNPDAREGLAAFGGKRTPRFGAAGPRTEGNA
jgi:enoyl-CoA hydratase/carnithine racemase